jgi:glycerol-3-phosphate acyltransferase PlsX
MEGTAKVMGEYMKRALRSTLVSKIGGLLARTALEGMKKRLDWREVGGAPLVGVSGVGFISHGRSDALAIENAIRRARETARSHFTDEIEKAVAGSDALLAAAEQDAGNGKQSPPRRVSPPEA